MTARNRVILINTGLQSGVGYDPSLLGSFNSFRMSEYLCAYMGISENPEIVGDDVRPSSPSIVVQSCHQRSPLPNPLPSEGRGRNALQTPHFFSLTPRRGEGRGEGSLDDTKTARDLGNTPVRSLLIDAGSGRRTKDPHVVSSNFAFFGKDPI